MTRYQQVLLEEFRRCQMSAPDLPTGQEVANSFRDAISVS